MNTEPERLSESRIALDILAYLTEHPNAQDTLEGIVEWWLLEQRIIYETRKVKAAIDRLMASGDLVEERRSNGDPVYRKNGSKQNEMELAAEGMAES